jgi:hypothetical protein
VILLFVALLYSIVTFKCIWVALLSKEKGLVEKTGQKWSENIKSNLK